MSAQIKEQQSIKKHYVNRISEIKDRMVSFIVERDNIDLVQNPALEAEYISKIGLYEIKLAEAEVEMRRAKRKLTMAKTCINNDQEVNLDAIDEVLTKEYEKWESGEGGSSPKTSNSNSNSARKTNEIPFDVDEFKKMYRELCKVLHPDLSIKNIENKDKIFEAVKRAYEKNDYVAILSYCFYLNLNVAPNFKDLEEVELSETLETYKIYEASALEQLRKLKDSFPQNVSDKLKSSIWVDKIVRNLKKKSEEFKKETKEYEAKLNYLMSTSKDE